MASAPAENTNILPLFDPPVRKSYRAAVKICVENAKRQSDLIWDDLADKLGCSEDTLTNALTEEHDLSGVTLLRIGYCFGEEAIKPALDLIRRRYEQCKTRADKFRDAHALLDELEKGGI